MGDSALLILESWSPEQFMFRHTIYNLVFMKLIRSYLSQGLAKRTTSTSNGVVEVGLTLKEQRNKVTINLNINKLCGKCLFAVIIYLEWTLLKI